MFTTEEVRLATFIASWTDETVHEVLNALIGLDANERLSMLKDEALTYESQAWFATECEDGSTAN